MMMVAMEEGVGAPRRRRRLMAAAASSWCILLLVLCQHRPVASFHQPNARSVLRLGVGCCSTSSDTNVFAAACGDDNADGRDSEIVSRRDMFRRGIYGVGLAFAASASNVETANALQVPNFLMASSSSDATDMNGTPTPSKKSGGLATKIRSVSRIMDELQRDLMQERWEAVAKYPDQFRSFVPVFTAYTDSAFPDSTSATDKGLGVALRYEVGRFFGSLERLRQATNRKSLEEAYVAYSDMALHFDRYLHVGGLYTFYDDNITLEKYYEKNPDTSLVYADPNKDPASVRDLIVLIKGPEKGRTGILIGIYPDGSNNCAVKLDRYKGIREIRVVPLSWAAKRVGEQDPDDVFLIPQST